MELPPEGKYVCKLNAQLIIYEASTGALCAAVPCVMVDSGFTLKHTLVLVKADGTIQPRTTETLKSVFGWDGVDPFWLMDNSLEGAAMRDIEFEIVGRPETGDKGGQYFKSQWINPLARGMKTPAPADRRSVLAKYGSKFQALAGVSPTAPAKGPAPGGTKSPPVPKTAPIAPPRGVPMATMEDAWATFNQAQVGTSAEAIEKLWFVTIARLFPNKSNTDLTAHEWGRLKAEFEDDIPM